MQSRATDDAGLRQALADAQTRIQTIAKLHDRLWRRGDIRTVDLADYLGDLCDHIRASAPNHRLICDVASVSVSTEQAIPVGLLVNELITNALKYAYPGGFGEVSLTLAPAEQEHHLRLQISDQGVGLPAGLGSTESGGLETKLVSTLSRQLGGQVEWQDGKPGTRFVMIFRPQKNHT